MNRLGVWIDSLRYTKMRLTLALELQDLGFNSQRLFLFMRAYSYAHELLCLTWVWFCEKFEQRQRQIESELLPKHMHRKSAQVRLRVHRMTAYKFQSSD